MRLKAKINQVGPPSCKAADYAVGSLLFSITDSSNKHPALVFTNNKDQKCILFLDSFQSITVEESLNYYRLAMPDEVTFTLE